MFDVISPTCVGIKSRKTKKGEITMRNKNYISVGKIAGACLDAYLCDNRKKESALKFSERVGFCAKTISRWRTNGVTSLEGLDCILQAMGKRVIIIDDDDDNSFFIGLPKRITSTRVCISRLLTEL